MIDPLPCECIVFRAITASKDIEKISGKPLRGSFLRRPPKEDGTLRDEKGLSVFFNFDKSLSPDEIARLIPLNGVKSLVTLHVGKVRDIAVIPRLDVEPTSDRHANITGLPAGGGGDPAEAERLATILANLARPFWAKS